MSAARCRSAAEVKDVLSRHFKEERRDAWHALLMCALMTASEQGCALPVWIAAARCEGIDSAHVSRWRWDGQALRLDGDGVRSFPPSIEATLS